MSSNLFVGDANPGLLVHEWTKNFRGGATYRIDSGGRESRPGGEWAERLFPATLASVPLGAARGGVPRGRSCLETLAGRHSVRQYHDAPLPRERLARLLELSHAQEGGGRPRQSCRLFPLVSNVAGIAPGAYLYDQQGHGLRQVRPEDPLPLIKEFCFQAEFTRAPVLILLAGSLAESLELHGDRGYRKMLFGAGLMIQRLYLAASYLGLAACVTGSIVPERLGAWLGMDGFDGTVLVAFAVGLPAPAGGGVNG